MKQLISCLLTLSIVSITFAADCNNPLLTTFDFRAIGNQPQAISGLKYCKSLQNAPSCCSADTINSIQDKTQALGEVLKNYVAMRDKEIVDARDNVIPGMQNNYQRLLNAYQQILTQLVQGGNTGIMAVLIQESSNNMNNLANAKNDFTSAMNLIMTPLTQIGDAVFNNLAAVKAGLKTVQKSRSSCMVELLKLQASAYCLACDPSYASKGVSGSTVTMSSRVCQRLQSSCYTFIAESSNQNGLITMKAMSAVIEKLAIAMEALARGDIAGINSMQMDGLSSSMSSSGYTGGNIPVTLPAGCTSESQCTWICKYLFKNGKLSDLSAVTGGTPYGLSETRLLVQEEEEEEEEEATVVRMKLQDKRRNLQSGSWDPEQDEAGVSVTFAEDPAGVNNGSLMKLSLVCVMAMLMGLLF